MTKKKPKSKDPVKLNIEFKPREELIDEVRAKLEELGKVEELIEFPVYEHVVGEPRLCFMCGEEAKGLDMRNPVPKEFFWPNEVGILPDNPHPVCKECNEFREDFDTGFLEMCKRVKFFELYRSTSKYQSEYYPQQLIFHISKKILLDLYFVAMEYAEEAWKEGNDKEWRKEKEEELNYDWRKRDA